VLGLTPDQEFDLGEQAYKQILSKAEVVREGPEVEQVNRVGGKIAGAVKLKPLQKEINLHLEGYQFKWEFNVLRDRQVNAFCLPGGKVAVYTGLLRLTGNPDNPRSDHLLAVVLSHEVAHALAHHSNERITREQMSKQAVEAAGRGMGGLGENQRRLLLTLLAGRYHFQELKYDREQESEADHIGLFLMTFAGYNPDAAIVFWERMAQASGSRSRPPEIFSTHPTDAHRIAQMKRWVPLAKAGKKAYDEGRIAR